MATAQELLALANQRRIPNTSLIGGGTRLPTTSRQVPPPEPMAHEGAQVKPGGMAAEQLRIAQSKGALTPQEPEGPGGVLGFAMKPLGKAMELPGVARALDALDTPRAMVVSTIKETSDLLPGFVGGDGSFDFGDLIQNTKDNYGFGDWIEPAMADRPLWARRAFGFVGDVFADPMTYLTFGSTAIAGKANRLRLAAKAEQLGMGAETIQKVGSRGAAALSAAERKQLGLAREGLYFGGSKTTGKVTSKGEIATTGFRVPLTGGVGKAVGTATGGLRHNIFDRRPWQWIHSAPEGLETAHQVLRTGKETAGMSSHSAAALVGWHDQFKAASQTFASQGAHSAKRALGNIDERARVAAVHAAESGTVAAGVPDLRPFFREMKDLAQKSGVDMGDLGPNFMPHRWLDEGRAFLKDRKVRTEGGQIIDLTKESGATLSRQIKGGFLEIDGKTIDIGGGTIKEINDALTKEFGAKTGIKKWLEDDAHNLIDSYVNGLAKDVGQVSAFNKLAASASSSVDWLDNISSEVIDDVATKTANKKLAKALRSSLAKRQGLLKAESAAAVEGAKDLRTQLAAQMDALIAGNETVAELLAAARADAGTAVKDVDDHIEGIVGAMNAARAKLNKDLQFLEKAERKLDADIAIAKTNLAVAKTEGWNKEFSRLTAQKIRLQGQIDRGVAAAEQLAIIRADMDAIVEKARNLYFDAENPDRVRALTAEMHPVVDVEVELSETAQKRGTRAAQVKRIDDQIKQMEASLLDDQAAEMEQLVDAQLRAGEVVIDSVNAEKTEQLNLVEKIKELNRARARRKYAEPLDPLKVNQGASWRGGGQSPAKVREDLLKGSGIQRTTNRDLLDRRIESIVGVDEAKKAYAEAVTKLEATEETILRMNQAGGRIQDAAAARAKELSDSANELEILMKGRDPQTGRFISEGEARVLTDAAEIRITTLWKEQQLLDGQLDADIRQLSRNLERLQNQADVIRLRADGEVGRSIDEGASIVDVLRAEAADEVDRGGRTYLYDGAEKVDGRPRYGPEVPPKPKPEVAKPKKGEKPAPKRKPGQLPPPKLVKAGRVSAETGEIIQHIVTLRDKVDDALAAKIKSDADIEVLLSKLPKAEQEVYDAALSYGRAKARTTAALKSQRSIDRTVERAERLGGGPQAALNGKKSVRDEIQRISLHNGYYTTDDFVKNKTIRTELPPTLEELAAREAALPSMEKTVIPAKIKAMVPDATGQEVEKLVANPVYTAASTRGIEGKKTYFNQINRGTVVSAEAVANAPAEAKQMWVKIARKAKRIADSSEAMSPFERELVAKDADLWGDFIARYDNVVKAGAEPSDELAAEVARMTVRSRAKASGERIKGLWDVAQGESTKGAGTRAAAALRADRVSNGRKLFTEVIEDGIDELDSAISWLDNAKVWKDHNGAQVASMGRFDNIEEMMNLRDVMNVEVQARLAAVKDARLALLRTVNSLTGGRYEWEDIGKLMKTPRADSRQSGGYDMIRKRIEKLFDDAMLGGRADDPMARGRGSEGVVMDELQRRARAKLSDERSLKQRLDQINKMLGGAGSEGVDVDWREAMAAVNHRNAPLNPVSKARGAIQAQVGEQAGVKAGLEAERADLLGQLGELGTQAYGADGKGGLARTVRIGREAQEKMQGLDPLQGAKELERVAKAKLDDLGAARELSRDKGYELVDDFLGQETRADGMVTRASQAKTAAEAVERALAGSEGYYKTIDKEMKATLKKLGEKLPKSDKKILERVGAESDAVIAHAARTGQPVDALTASMHTTYVSNLADMGRAADQVDQLQAAIKSATASSKGRPSKRAGKNFHEVFKREALDGYQQVMNKLMTGPDAVVMKSEMEDGLKRLMQSSENGELWKTIEKATLFFKTYATATPGFHVRNAMSASFMNFTDGVTFKAHREAMGAWNQYEREGSAYLAKIKVSDPQLYSAFEAAFGSGAGGAWSRAELSDIQSKVFHNFWTNTSRNAGERVEGWARLAATLDATRNGASTTDAMVRAERLHFNYSDLGKLDRKMKVAIPFWVFMSRNLPLQLQQGVRKPGLYKAYWSAVENFGAGNEFEGMPEWLADQNPIPLGRRGDKEMVLNLDLPFNNLGADVAETLDFRDPLRALSNLNPLAIAPAEALAGERFRYGSEFENNFDRALHPINQIVSPVAQAQRLLGLGRYQGQAMEKSLQWMGVPLQQVDDEERARAIKSAYYERNGG